MYLCLIPYESSSSIVCFVPSYSEHILIIIEIVIVIIIIIIIMPLYLHDSLILSQSSLVYLKIDGHIFRAYLHGTLLACLDTALGCTLRKSNMAGKWTIYR